MKTIAPKKGPLSRLLWKNSKLLWGRRAAVFSITLLTGCTSFVNIGESDYSCPGIPGGVQCMSTRDAYEATNDGHVPRAMSSDKAQAEGTHSHGFVSSNLSNQQTVQQQEQQFINKYIAPYLPDKPIPIRTPAEVMRIWVAPWEDERGDLIATGYIFTEIEARRWVVGEEPAASAPTLRPLQVTKEN